MLCLHCVKSKTEEWGEWGHVSVGGDLRGNSAAVAAQRTICDENKDDAFIIGSLGWGLCETSSGSADDILDDRIEIGLDVYESV